MTHFEALYDYVSTFRNLLDNRNNTIEVVDDGNKGADWMTVTRLYKSSIANEVVY